MRGPPPTPGHTLHVDVWGPARTTTPGGSRYVMGVIDGCSNMNLNKLLSSTSEVADIMKEIVRDISAQGKTVSMVVSDNATYFQSHMWVAFCARMGVRLRFSPTYTPALNGKVERHFGTVIGMVRTMLGQSGVPRRMWGEAAMYASTILNTIPRGDDASNMSPVAIWTSNRVSGYLHWVKPFGCAAWVLNKKQGLDKLDPKGEMHILLGMEPDNFVYRLGTLPGMQVVFSAHVVFNEQMFPCRTTGGTLSEVAIEEVTGTTDVTQHSGQDQTPRVQEPQVRRRSGRSRNLSAAGMESLVYVDESRLGGGADNAGEEPSL